MSEPLDWKTLDRCLAGEASPAEREALARWMEGDPARAAMVEALRGRASAPGGGDASGQAATDAAWERLAARISAQPARPALHVLPGGGSPSRRTPAPAWRTPWLRIAAAVLLLLGGGALVWRLADPAAEAPADALREASTGVGERRTLRLADGTEVTLGVGSRLRYPARFGGAERRVELQGEALFRVAKRADQPFLVSAGESVTRVLGTEFGVRAYPGAGEGVRVVVAEGRVLLRGDGAPESAGVVLARGDVARLASRGDKPTVRHDADPERLLGWTSGRLVFEDASLREIAAELERWYGVRVRVADSALARRRLSAELQGGSLEQTLETLSLALDAEYRREGNTVTFSTAR